MKTRHHSQKKKINKKSFTMKLNNNTECKVYNYKLVKHQCMSVAFSVLKNENENCFSAGSLAVRICDQDPFIAAVEHSTEDVRPDKSWKTTKQEASHLFTTVMYSTDEMESAHCLQTIMVCSLHTQEHHEKQNLRVLPSSFQLHVDRLVGLVVKASASRAEGPGFESRCRVIPLT